MKDIIDMVTVEEAKYVMKAKFPMVIEYFIEDAAGYIDSAKRAFSTGNTAALISSAHTLKSSSRQLGAAKLSEIAEEIEHKCRANGNHVSIADLIPKMENCFAETVAVLNRL